MVSRDWDGACCGDEFITDPCCIIDRCLYNFGAISVSYTAKRAKNKQTIELTNWHAF
jgi:hypothetical protein